MALYIFLRWCKDSVRSPLWLHSDNNVISCEAFSGASLKIELYLQNKKVYTNTLISISIANCSKLNISKSQWLLGFRMIFLLLQSKYVIFTTWMFLSFYTMTLHTWTLMDVYCSKLLKELCSCMSFPPYMPYDFESDTHTCI